MKKAMAVLRLSLAAPPVWLASIQPRISKSTLSRLPRICRLNRSPRSSGLDELGAIHLRPGREHPLVRS
jgi:hypothetical protein